MDEDLTSMLRRTYDEQKRLRTAYRAKAREMYEDVGRQETEYIKVPEHANVQIVEDGAFIECVVWVPKEAL